MGRARPLSVTPCARSTPRTSKATWKVALSERVLYGLELYRRSRFETAARCRKSSHFCRSTHGGLQPGHLSVDLLHGGEGVGFRRRLVGPVPLDARKAQRQTAGI